MQPQIFPNFCLKESLFISLGAIVGALSRYYITLTLKNIFDIHFPLATLFINVTGSFLMGVFVGLLSTKIIPIPSELILTIAVGFLGAYTTFSGYELDAFNLLEKGFKQLSIFYWLGSPILGFLSIKFGLLLVKYLP